MKALRLLILVLLLLAASCTSIVHGRYQRVDVRSSPAGAAIAVNCGDAPSAGGVTPAQVRLRRGAEHCALTLTKSGYAESTVTFTRARSGAVWSNIVPGILLGTVIGAASAPVVVFSDSSKTEQRANTVAVAGIVAGTGIGVWIDHSTGPMYRQVPGSVDVTLAPRAQP